MADKQPIRYPQQGHPHTHQRQVDDDQHQVADPIDAIMPHNSSGCLVMTATRHDAWMVMAPTISA